MLTLIRFNLVVYFSHVTIHVAHPGSQDLEITVRTLEEGVRVSGRLARPASSCTSVRDYKSQVM